MILDWTIAAAAIAIFATLGSIAVKWITSTIQQDGNIRAAGIERIEDSQDDIKSDLHTLQTSMDKRIDRLEQQSGGFMHKDEILTKFEHASNNRKMNQDAFLHYQNKRDDDMSNIRDRLTKVETNHSHVSREVGEVKGMIKDQSTKLDQLCDAVTKIIAKMPG